MKNNYLKTIITILILSFGLWSAPARAGNIDAILDSLDNTSAFVVQNSGLTELFRVSGNGNVGIGTANPSVALDVVGTIDATAVKVGGTDVLTAESDPGLQTLSIAEIDQLELIDLVTISAAQWGFLGAMTGQPLESESDPGLQTLSSAEIDQLELIGATTISAAQWGFLGAMGGQPIETEADPQVDAVTSGNFCKGTGTTVSCTDTNTYLTSFNETDSTLTDDGAVTLGSGGGDVTLTFDADAGTDGTLVWDGINDDFSILNGNLGIGTASPQTTLDVVTDNVSQNTVIPSLRLTRTASGPGDDGLGTSIEFNLEDALGSTTIASKIETKWQTADGIDNEGRISFYTLDGADDGLVSRMTLNEVGDLLLQTGSLSVLGSGSSSFTGNLGIGTAAPGTKLHVDFDVPNTTLTGTTAYGGIHLDQSITADEFVGITTSSASSGTQGGILFQGSGSYGTKIHFLTTDSFAAGQKNRMTLDHLGNLGIGDTTPTEGKLVVAGNIAVTGTVDGRDVAADGTKLDGIEAGAGADQTAAEILTAIKTVDGAASGLDADLLDGLSSAAFSTGAHTVDTTCDGVSCNVTNTGTLDGLNASSFLRSDADDTLTSAIIVAGANRDEGIFGTFDATKTQHVWSMGTAYRNSAAGTDFGNLYGMAYCHTNNANCTAGLGHQIEFVNNGTVGTAIGFAGGIWTSGDLTVNGDDIITDGVLRLRPTGDQVILGSGADNVDLYIADGGLCIDDDGTCPGAGDGDVVIVDGGVCIDDDGACTAPADGQLDMTSGRIINVADPTAAQDAATKAYVDAAAAGPHDYHHTSASTYTGSTADTACAAGYHMCSLNEWYGRRYDDSNGDHWDAEAWYDSGTGISSNSRGDCTNWSSTSGNGMIVNLKLNTAGAYEFKELSCVGSRRVLCCSD